MTARTHDKPEIRRPQALDAQWFTRMLRATGIDAEVRSVTAEPVGTGQVGDSLRFHLEPAHASAAIPATLVGKFPAADPQSFQSGVSGGNYVREVRFYQRLAATAGIATPQCHYAEVDPDSGEYVLILEDLAPARQGDQLAGVTVDQARLAVIEAARLHASHWGDERLEEESWIVGSRAAARSPISPQVFRDFLAGFEHRFGAGLDGPTLLAGRRLAERIDRFGTAGSGARCLVHGDFRPDNLMLASPAGGHPITVLDWQSIGLGAAAIDVGYFLAGALPPDVLRVEEAGLLASYAQTLATHGVVGYAGDAVQRDHAAGGLRLLYIAIASSMRMKQTRRGDTMFMHMATCAADHIRRHDALALLD